VILDVIDCASGLPSAIRWAVVCWAFISKPLPEFDSCGHIAEAIHNPVWVPEILTSPFRKF